MFLEKIFQGIATGKDKVYFLTNVVDKGNFYKLTLTS